ncbi:MAG: Rieske 2Fe-2S domain-containing protein [Nostoc sp. ChiQUE02]|uniref:Rieske 2Fe-2S domain-containing protein n=1 Tax=Nostoc sp. ChiQUE02 TaxID=3075377 RepID=UPI002AD4BF95|nr:Rieske 2Fe-2S domain-containing protein [Nostoc sp. ChiQUE02]MDZ8233031.1 phytanoyl-CoA dioxygenase family protein [Nostoc sp. ChiQUE02]
MQHPTVTNISLHDHTESMLQEKISERVLSGEVIIVRQSLQAIGYFESLQEASLNGIRRATGQEKAAKIKNKGFEAFHEVINLDELPSVTHHTYEVVRSLAPKIAKKLIKKVFQQEKAFYFEEYPNVRFHVPYDIVVQRKDEFNTFAWNGKVTAHGPHHDSWYQCPTNSINIWIAIGKVKIGNGLNIYPQVYGKLLPCTKDGKIQRDQYFGSALNFELEPGDALIFHGEHLHSSEINSTDATRHVISLRMTLDKPKFLNPHSPYKYDYIYSQPNDGFWEEFTQFVVRKFHNISKKNNSIIAQEKNQNYIISPEIISKFDDTSMAFPQEISVKTSSRKLVGDTKLILDSKELKLGEIRPISQKLCAAKINERRVVVFDRYCPHEGADLAAGYLRNDCVVCPWHNLPINLQSGASPCQSLQKISVFDYQEESQKIKVSEAE